MHIYLQKKSVYLMTKNICQQFKHTDGKHTTEAPWLALPSLSTKGKERASSVKRKGKN